MDDEKINKDSLENDTQPRKRKIIRGAEALAVLAAVSVGVEELGIEVHGASCSGCTGCSGDCDATCTGTCDNTCKNFCCTCIGHR